jgi:glucose-6-phosphate 1-dehydrogenase
MNTVFLVFGITGDLMRKKGIPALFALYKKGALPPGFRLVGFSRKEWDTAAIRMLIKAALGEGALEDDIESFAGLFQIIQGEGTEESSYPALKAAIGTPEQLFIYLCISPELYERVIRNLGAQKLLEGKETRILIEKPFGSDLVSAQALQALLLSFVSEEQIFRIDHFLAKEAMSDLSAISQADILSIEVYLNESLGVEKRGAMYDPVGAFRDVGQNHLLEAGAAVLGDRTAALEELHILSSDEMKGAALRGQHEGYSSIEGVASNSQTETYFKVESRFEHEGKNIRLLLESGKRLPWRREVVVTFTNGEKKIIPFESGTNEYEMLFKEAFAGDRHRFVNMREVEALWRFTDPIEKAWKENAVPLLPYASDKDFSPIL